MKKALPLYILVSLMLFCSAQAATAQDIQKSAAPEPDRSAPHKETVNGKTEPAPAVWPKPFAPREEVGADSQISLPTDI